MARKERSIYERQTSEGVRYDVKWRDYGSPVLRTRTFRTLAAAREHRHACDRARDERRPYVDAPPPAPRLTLAGLATAYLADRQRVTRSAAALDQREIALGQFIGWLAAGLDTDPQPEHLTRAALAGFHAWLQTDRAVPTRLVNGRSIVRTYKAGVGTANQRVRYVEAWWRWLAESDEYPDGAIPAPRRIDLLDPPAPPPPEAPTWAEMAAAIDCARPSWARLLTVLYFTGLREGQAMRLRRADVDLEALTLTVRSDLGKSRQERAGRTVPISPHLAAAIRTWPADPDGWLVAWDATSPRYDRPKREADRDTARRILQRAGVREAVWRTKRDADGQRRNAHPLHCYRAGLISGLTAAGVDERTIRALVGHDRGVTGNRYTDAAALDLRSAVALIPPLTPKPGGRVVTMRDYRRR